MDRNDIKYEHFSTGVGACANGRIFMTLMTVGLALKLPEDSRELLIGKGAKPLRISRKAPKKDYAVLPKALADDEETLASLVRESIRFAQAFPTTTSPRPRSGPADRGLPT